MRLNIAGGKDTRVRKKIWRAEHRTNGQGLPLAENGFPGVPSSAGSGGGQSGPGVPRTNTSKPRNVCSRQCERMATHSRPLEEKGMVPEEAPLLEFDLTINQDELENELEIKFELKKIRRFIAYKSIDLYPLVKINELIYTTDELSFLNVQMGDMDYE